MSEEKTTKEVLQEKLPVEERLESSLAATTLAVYNGAKIIRAHDVKETKRVVEALEC